MNKINFPDKIEGKMVVLEPFNESHIVNQYIDWLNDPIVSQYSNQRFITHTKESCQRYFKSFVGTNNIFVAVTSKKSGMFIGTMTAYVAIHHGTADIGILIGERSAWGKGYGLDAWQTIMKYLSELPNMRKLSCGTLEINKSMRSIAEKSGMVLDGIRKSQELVDGVPVDMYHYARFLS